MARSGFNALWWLLGENSCHAAETQPLGDNGAAASANSLDHHDDGDDDDDDDGYGWRPQFAVIFVRLGGQLGSHGVESLGSCAGAACAVYGLFMNPNFAMCLLTTFSNCAPLICH